MNTILKKRDILRDKNHIHFVGIGGIGMSAIAQILFREGYYVSGSDIKASPLTNRLADIGIEVFIGHDKENAKGADLLVYSSCVADDNPEISSAKKTGVSVISRGKMLAEISKDLIAIAVAGAHGKTTTTGMISSIFVCAGADPTVATGGITSFLEDGNARKGNGDFFIAEADESDGSFMELIPTYPVVTNVDMEHLDYYHDINEIMAAYGKFISNMKEGGKLVINNFNAYSKELIEQIDCDYFSFGLSSQADFYPKNIKLDGMGSRFECIHKKNSLGTIELNVPGIYNIENALAAIACSSVAGISFEDIKKGLKAYDGTKRRFEVRYTSGDIMIIEDYAHHPTEIKAAIEAASHFGRRMICVFQPHRYSRTKLLLEQFISCFEGVDELVITDIYAASEMPLEDVTGWMFCESLKKSGCSNVNFCARGNMLSHLEHIVKEKDVVLVMGAGDIGNVANQLSEKLKV